MDFTYITAFPLTLAGITKYGIGVGEGYSVAQW